MPRRRSTDDPLNVSMWICDSGADLPSGLSFLDMRNNPCCSDLTLTKRVCEALPNLRTLNGQNLDEESELDDDVPGMPEGNAHKIWEAVESPDSDNGLAAESSDIIRRSRQRIEQVIMLAAKIL